MPTTDENRIAFARGIAHLLLTHVKRLSAKDRKYIQRVADATTAEQMHASAYTAYASAYASAAASAYASAAASAYASVSASAYAYWTDRACVFAVKAGVPADAVHALRGLLVTE